VKVPEFHREEPRETVKITLALDREVLDWFRATGRGYQRRVNDVLRWYIDQVEKQRARDDGSAA
jgi:uncharacterized protein (DUF4415 family)